MESEGTPQFKSIKRSLCLPEEIVEEILSRLPVKSLLRFRCVSKPWRDLIGSEHFIKKHLHTSTENPNFTHHSIILNSIEPQLGLKQCSLISMLSDPFIDQFTFCDLENIGRESICIVGCCNGLVSLLLDDKHFMLWNPSTRKAKQLPAFDHYNEDWYMSSYGFGYDDLSGGYLVFGIASLFYSSRRYETINKVYSLQRNSWKVVKRGNIPPCYDEGNFASGKLHWSRDTGMGWDIVSFDLRSKVYDAVELPCCSKEFDCIPVGVFGGRLSLLCECSSHLDVWILKESWEKVATLPSLRTRVEGPYPPLLVSGMGPNGEILVTGLSTVVIYYPEGDGFQQCQVRDLGVFHEAVVCVESFVLL